MYSKTDIEIDDYVKLRDSSDWLRVTYKHEHVADGFDAVDDFGTPLSMITYSYIIAAIGCE